jgi:hypothetical protein
MAATTLQIYNSALTFLGEKELESVAENRASRRALDAAFPRVKQYCLEQGIWGFALRPTTATGTANTTFGMTYGIAHPSDMARLFVASSDASFNTQLSTGDFVDQGGIFYFNTNPLYISYTSVDSSYGGDLTKWTETFAMYVAAALANFACVRITGNMNAMKFMASLEGQKYATALAADSVSLPPGQLPFNKFARNNLATDKVRADVMPYDSVLQAAASVADKARG